MRTRILISLAFLVSALGLSPAFAQEKGEGSIGLVYQYVHTDVFSDDVGDYDYWTTDTHALVLSGSYAFRDNWSVSVTLPYIQKRFVSEVPWGGDPHNPNDPWWIDFEPPDKRFIDDGDYHGGLQDMSISVSYTALDGPLTLSPFIGYGFPVSDYQFYAKAARGFNLWNIPVGVDFMYVPYFSDWYVSGNVAYVFSEKPLGVNVDYWNAQVSTGYWFKPNFSAHVFLSLKHVIDGLQMPWDFTDDPTYANYPDEFDTELWYNHDRLLQHRNLNAGIGFDYFFNERYQVSGGYYVGLRAEQSSEPGKAFSLGVTRYFGKD